MKEIFPGLYQINLTLAGFNPDSINIYLVKDKASYTIVDTGWDTPAALESLYTQFKSLGITPADIKRVLLTHAHVDHLGNSDLFKRSGTAKIYLHQNEIDLMKIRFKDRDNFIPMTDEFLSHHGVPPSELTPPEFQIPRVPRIVEPDVLLVGGEVIECGEYTFKVVNTPGHTPGHVSYYEPDKKFLISGDVLLPTIATNAAFHIQHFKNALSKYMETLLTLQQTAIETVLPAHEYIFNAAGARIEELIKKQIRKSEEVQKVLTGDRNYTAYDVALALAWSSKTQASNWPNLSGWDKRFALLLAVANLENIAGYGKIYRFLENGTIYYR